MTRSGHPDYIKVRNLFVKAYARKGDFESKLPSFTHTVHTYLCTIYCASPPSTLSLCIVFPLCFLILPSNSLSLSHSITVMNHTPLSSPPSHLSLYLSSYAHSPSNSPLLIFSFSLPPSFLDCRFQFFSFVWRSFRG